MGGRNILKCVYVKNDKKRWPCDYDTFLNGENLVSSNYTACYRAQTEKARTAE